MTEDTKAPNATVRELYEYLKLVGKECNAELVQVHGRFAENSRRQDFTMELAQFIGAVNLALVAQSYKAVPYGRSWFKRGLQGAFFTIARKWDRLEQYITLHGNNIEAMGGGDEGIEEVVLDLAVYCIKLLGALQGVAPGRYDSLVRKTAQEAVSYNDNVTFDCSPIEP